MLKKQETALAAIMYTLSLTNNPYLTLKSSLISKALGIDKNFKDFQIIEISDQKLVLRFKHALFTNKTTVIEDTFLPADEEMNDRYFHW